MTTARWTPRAAVIGCALTTGLAGGLLAAPRAESAPAAVGALKTGLGSPAGEIVVLELTGSGGGRAFARVRPDGTVDAAPYAVPAGQALYVTDGEWVLGYKNQDHGAYERALRVRLVNVANPASPGTAAVMGFVPFPQTFDTTGLRVHVAGQWRPQTGFVVGAGCRIEADAPETLDTLSGDPVTQALHGDVVLRGYLLRAK